MTHRSRGLAGDLWGGLASMLVALPASLAFGVAIYAPLGPSHAGQGALAGVLGAAAIGIAAPLLGGTERLVSAPCAPAAAVMGALALELVSGHGGAAASPERVIALLTLAALFSGALQALYGVLGGGTLIKYIPYPVVTGYLSGVGVVIFLKQLHGLFGFPRELSNWQGLTQPSTWSGSGLVVGLATIAAMLLAPRLTKRVPAAILGLAAGITCYFALGLLLDARLLTLADNHLVIGPLGGAGGSPLGALGARFSALREVGLADVRRLAMPALTLSVLLSIDTLKTCVVVDALTRTRHASNRELVGQGVANLASAAIGGVPGSGTSGATLVNIASGAETRLSGLIEGVLVIVAYLALGGLVAWAPIASLAGILVVVAFRMFDRGSFRLLRQRSTLLDFVVVAAVIAVAVLGDLVAASGTGVALSILLFIREQVRGSVIHRKTYGDQVFSRQKRLPEERAVLERRGRETVACELAGSLFFGTTDQLFTHLEADLERCRFVILDLRRVRSVDLTAAHMLGQWETRLRERDGTLLFSSVPKSLPSGLNLRDYFDEVGLVAPQSPARTFDELSDALEWAEDRLLEEEGRRRLAEEVPLGLREIGFLGGRGEDTLRHLEACVVERRCEAGEPIFRQGDTGDEIFLVRRGRVRVALRFDDGRELHLATFGRADAFGEVAFLDRGARSADAVALTRAELFVISRERFDALVEEHPRLGMHFFEALARSLAIRLRQADAEIRVLGEA
jgi:SulP family sulfate permease